MSKCANCTRDQHITKTIEDHARNPEQIDVCHRCYQDECEHKPQTEISAGGKMFCPRCGIVDP